MKKNILTALILFFATAATYIFTAPQSVYTGDSGEIATAVYTWGIAHPTGFPAYLILAKLFSYLLPIFEFAYRLNIFSAVCGAATVAILFFILQKILFSSPFHKGGGRVGDFCPSIAAALSLAFGFTFWAHSTMLQVYSLTALCFALAILIFLYWMETGKPKHLYLLAIICGMGAGTHLSFFLFFPFALILFVLKLLRKEIKINIRQLFFSFLVFLFLCSLVYAYIPWRAAQSPDLNWGNPSTVENFINYITQRDYSDKIGTRSFESWSVMLKEVGRLFSREFTWFGLIFVLFGAAIACKKNRPFFYAGLSVIFFNILLLGNYGNNQDIMILWRYFLPSYIIMAIFLGYLFSVIPALPRVIPAQAGIQAIILPAIIFIAHFGALDRHDNFLVQNATRDIFNSVPRGAVLIIDGDTLVGGTMYEQIVLKKRQDIILISDKLFTYPWYQEIKKKELEARGKKYATNISYLIRDNADTEFFSITNSGPILKMNYNFYSQGMVYKLLNKKESIKLADVVEKNEKFWKDYDFEFLKDQRFLKDYFENELVKIYIGDLINLAAYLTNNGDVSGGIEYFKKSLEIRENKSALYNLAGIYNELGDKKKALEYKQRFDVLDQK